MTTSTSLHSFSTTVPGVSAGVTHPVSRVLQTQVTLTYRFSPAVYAVVLCAVAGLVTAAVLATGMTVRTSYERAQLQQRAVQAQQELRRLDEQYAQVTALPALMSYAEEHGYTEASAPVATVDLQTTVAQAAGAPNHD